MATLQLITRSQFFLEYNFNYTNMSNFLIWYKLDFAKLTNKEMETLKAKMLKLPTMSMELFDSILENIDENYPFSLSLKLILALLISVGICIIAIGIIFIWYKRKTSLTSSTVGNLIKLVPSLNEKIPTLNSLLPILSELTSSQNNVNVITPVAVSPQLSQTPLDELILKPVLVPQLQLDTQKDFNYYKCSSLIEPITEIKINWNWTIILGNVQIVLLLIWMTKEGLILKNTANIYTKSLDPYRRWHMLLMRRCLKPSLSSY